MARKLRTITSYAGHARYIAEVPESDWYAGEVSSAILPRTPYSFGDRKPLMLHPTDGYVAICETSHKRYEVWQVPASAVLASRD